MFLLLSLFDDFFSINSFLLQNPNKRITKSYFQTYIYNSIFTSLFFNGNGGAISYNNVIIELLIENCIFFECGANDFGGAISFLCSNNGGCVLNKVCGFQCYILNTNNMQGGQFSFINTNNNKINEVHFTSITKCYNSTIGSKNNVILLKSGEQIIKNLNSSSNSLMRYSGFSIHQSVSSNISFCTIINNKVSNEIVLWFYQGIHNVYYLNIIKNNSPSWGIVTLDGTNSNFFY